MISDEDLLEQIEAGILADEPISKTLRAFLLLGGRLNSDKLRVWAKRELEGYYGIDDALVPEARTVGAPIHVNAIVGYNQITGQSVSAAALPSPFRDTLKDDIILRNPIAEIEGMIVTARQGDRTFVTLTIPNWEAIAHVLDKDVFGQHTTMLYREVSLSYLHAIVAEVRNRAAELMGEFRRTMRVGRGQELPHGAQADQLVSGVVVRGDNNSVVVSRGKVRQGSVGALPRDARAPSNGGGWWDAWGRAASIIGAIVGVVTIVIVVYVTISSGSIPAP